MKPLLLRKKGEKALGLHNVYIENRITGEKSDSYPVARSSVLHNLVSAFRDCNFF
jgi:hypothetical protein